MRGLIVRLVPLCLSACAAIAERAWDELSFSPRQQVALELDDLDNHTFLYDHLRGLATSELKTRSQVVYRPRSPVSYQSARLRSLRYGESEPIEWDRLELAGPDVRDRHTLVQLARMAGDAYAFPGSKRWYEVDEIWNNVRSTVYQRPALSYHLISAATDIPRGLGRSS
jgi:hypothetical protein